MADPVIGPRPSVGVERAGDVLSLVRAGDGVTVSELAARTGLARSTVQQRLTALADVGLVRAGPAAVNGRGRPAQPTRFVTDAAAVLGVHVGLTGSRLAVADLTGTVIDHAFVELAVTDGPERVVAALVAAARGLLGREGMPRRLAGVGVGLPSRTDLIASSAVDGGDPAEWHRSRVADRLRAALGAPVFPDLDVNLLALAEGARRPEALEGLVCVKLGTAIDAAIVVGGRPVRGVDDLAGELGHVKVPRADTLCPCGGRGCLTAVASGQALVTSLRGQGLRVNHVRDVVALAARDDARAVAAIRGAGRVIGQALASVVTLLNPGVIAVWGYLAEADTPLFAGLREGLYADALPSASAHVELVRTAAGELSGVTGAITLVLDRVLEPAAVDRLLAAGGWPEVSVASLASDGSDGSEASPATE